MASNRAVTRGASAPSVTVPPKPARLLSRSATASALSSNAWTGPPSRTAASTSNRPSALSRTTPTTVVQPEVSNDALTEYDRKPIPNENEPVPLVIDEVMAAQLITDAAVCDSEDAP